MQFVFAALGLFLALVGHCALWTGVVNRLHGIDLPRRLIKAIGNVAKLAILVVPPYALWKYLAGSESAPLFGYRWACVALGAVAVIVWAFRRLVPQAASAVALRRGTPVDVVSRLGGHLPVHGNLWRLLARLPGNQVLTFTVDDLTLPTSALPVEAENLSIVHISDLHLTGRIGREFFQQAVRAANDLNPDLIVVTGDIVETTNCFSWIPETLGRLRARHGVYFVLGNHDLLTRDVPGLRAALVESGLVDVAQQPVRLPLAGYEILLVGNEAPWFRSPAAEGPIPARRANELRILAAHTPDLFDWAQRNDFDVMLCGHTHGGQIRLPLIGSVLCPSVHGLRYLSGTFTSERTTMYVNRGLSSVLPVRLLCPPEITHLVLKSTTVEPAGALAAAQAASSAGRH